MSSAHDLNTRNFLRNLAKEQNTYFITPWAGVIVRNCDASGGFITHKTAQLFIQSKTPVWIFLKVKLFRDEDGIYGAFICPTCESMSSVLMMTMDQRRGDIESLLCLHSKAAAYRTDWREIWGLPAIDLDTLSHCFQPGLDTRVVLLSDNDPFLAAVQNNGDVQLIFTLSKKNTSPFCSKCSTQKCKHFKQYKDFIDQMDVNSMNNSNHSDGSSNSNSTASSASTASSETGNENPQGNPPPDHYDDIEPIDEYTKKYGYNLSKIVYPPKMDPVIQEAWIRRLEGHYDLPEKITPEFVEGFSCRKHGNTFDPNDSKLVQYSKNIIIYTETSEKVYNIKTYARRTIGGCRCKQQADTNNLLLWHLGKGKLIDYLFLSGYMHNMRANGTSKYGLYRSRCERLNSIGVKTSLTQKDFLRATNGFISRIVFNEDLKTFSCPKCGVAPKYLVADGKSDGPTKRKVEHLKELGTAEGDTGCLPQGSFHKDRVFTSVSAERQAICQVITGTLSVGDFLTDPGIETENGRLVVGLINRIAATWGDEIPKEYKKFMANICKQSSVAGLLQVTSNLPLTYLESFCHESLDIRSVEEMDKLGFVQKQIPAFWPILTDILNLEGTKYLPVDVRAIVLKLVAMRRNTFINAATRNNEDYTDWLSPEAEDPTQFYPEFPIFRYPKRYTVSGQKDVDVCNKAFDEKRDFSYGVFSIGCCCDLNITYGFELMLCKESAHNFFR